MTFRTGDRADRDVLTVEGRVISWAHSHGKVEVTMAGKPFVVTAHRSGKLRMNHVHVLEGDMVKVELSPFDLRRGRIIERERSPRS